MNEACRFPGGQPLVMGEMMACPAPAIFGLRAVVFAAVKQNVGRAAY